MRVRRYCLTCRVISCYEKILTVNRRLINNIIQERYEKSTDINGSNIETIGQFLNRIHVDIFSSDRYDCSCRIVPLIKACVVHILKIIFSAEPTCSPSHFTITVYSFR